MSGSGSNSSMNDAMNSTESSAADEAGRMSGSGSDGSTEEFSLETIGIMAVAGIAIILMITAFTIWYRRSHRAKLAAAAAAASSSSNHDLSPRSKGDHYSTLFTGRTSYETEFLSRNQGGTWDDPAIIAAKVPLEKIEIVELISRGGYGEVYRGVYNRQSVAIKKLLPATRKDLQQIERFFAEAKLMIAFEHPRIVQFIGVAWDSLSEACVVTEFMDGGDLRALLVRFEEQERRQRGFDCDKVKIALHVIHALTYLHSLSPVVLHRDLKSKNILLSAQWDAKLTDFGVSREQSDATMTAGVGSSLWMAPEVMMGEQYSEKADIFSFGVVLSELDSHLLPYAESKVGGSDTAILQLVSMGKLQVQFSESAMPEVRELGLACVAYNPQDRPTTAEILYKLQLALKKLLVII
ncbi:Tkl protein kinase, partial [Globisporangium splendens]